MPFSRFRKDQILERAGGKCEVCGDDGVLQAHSVDRSHKDEGVALCANWQGKDACHSIVHEISNDPDILEEVTEAAIDGDAHGLRGREYLLEMVGLVRDP